MNKFAGVVFLVITVILWSIGSVYAEEQEKEKNAALTWITIQDDDGYQDSHWGVSCGPMHVLCKIININLDTSDIVAAKVQYKMGTVPWFPPDKKRLKIGWADMVILVNDTVVVQKPGNELASIGWHEVTIKPELLKKGDNTIKFTWH